MIYFVILFGLVAVGFVCLAAYEDFMAQINFALPRGKSSPGRVPAFTSVSDSPAAKVQWQGALNFRRLLAISPVIRRVYP